VKSKYSVLFTAFMLLSALFVVGLTGTASAASPTLTLTDCTTDVAGRTFEVEPGYPLTVVFTDPCLWDMSNYAGFASANRGSLSAAISLGDGGTTIGEIERSASFGQVTLTITAQPGQVGLSTNTTYFRAPGDFFQLFTVRVSRPVSVTCPTLSGSAPYTVTPGASAGVNWSGCALQDADFRGANLNGADLSGADLSGADLSAANLSNANLTGANLDNADFGSITMGGATLERASFSGANFSDADLNGLDFSNLVADGAIFSGGNLTSVNFSGANLTEADFTGADLTQADFSGAGIEDAMFNSPDAFVRCSDSGNLGTGIPWDPGTTLPAGWSFSAGTLFVPVSACVIAPVIPVAVTLDYRGGSTGGVSVTSAVLQVGGTTNSLPTPSKNALEFTGWFSTSSLLQGRKIITVEASDAGNIFAGFIPPELVAVLETIGTL